MKKEMIEAYYKDMKEELIARSTFPNSSQNKKRIRSLKEDMNRLRDLWGAGE